MSVIRFAPPDARVIHGFDGPCIIRDRPWGSITAFTSGIEIMPNLDDDGTIKLDGNAARELAKTLMSYAYHLERWESAARGDDLVLVTRKDGAIWVTWRRRTVLMRLSKLRRAQSCTHCTQKAMALWVQAQTYLYDAVSVGGTRFHHARVCEPCVDTLASATTDLREVVGSSP